MFMLCMGDIFLSVNHRDKLLSGITTLSATRLYTYTYKVKDGLIEDEEMSHYARNWDIGANYKAPY